MLATLPAPEQTVKAYKSLSNEELQERIDKVASNSVRGCSFWGIIISKMK
jgi:hypothetical protein